MSKVVLFYGSFDPPHTGHLKIAQEALKTIKGDKLYFGLNKNSNSKNLAPFSKRKKMIDIVIKDKKKFFFLDIKFDYKNLDETYNQILNWCNDDHEYYILIGQDQLKNLTKWHKFELIKTKFKFIIANRGCTPYDLNSDYIYLNNKTLNISSNDIKKGNYKNLNQKVKEYIINNNLYLEKQIKEYMSLKRYKHTISVKKTALEIYKNNKSYLNRNKVITAALLHDIAKEYPKNKTKIIMKNHYPTYMDESESLYHQYVGEYLTKKKFKITDKEILEAIRYHTTGNENMGPLAKLIYASDKIEPTRGYDSSYLINECKKNLDNGFIKVLDDNLSYLKTKNMKYINEETEKAIKYYLKGEN